MCSLKWLSPAAPWWFFSGVCRHIIESDIHSLLINVVFSGLPSMHGRPWDAGESMVNL